jgi:hypothetical protein
MKPFSVVGEQSTQQTLSRLMAEGARDMNPNVLLFFLTHNSSFPIPPRMPRIIPNALLDESKKQYL